MSRNSATIDEADDARDQALVQRLLAERRRDLRLRDQLELDRQRAGLQQVREVLGRLDREAARDLRAVGARRCRPGSAGSRCTATEMSSLSSTIAKCWNAVCGSLPRRAALSWPRWAISRVVFCQIAAALAR